MKKVFLTLTFLALPIAAFAAQGKAMIIGTAEDSRIVGDVMLLERKGGLLVTATLKNVPAGKHGFHIHETGSCMDKGNAAGGHFNPDSVTHGLLTQHGFTGAHAGDIGNITIKKNGTGKLKIFLPGLNLTEGPYAVQNKAIILHEKEDDFGQPTGNAGGRIGCGVIELTETK